jgi:hypothetical protein
MQRPKIRLVNIIYWLALLALDVFVFMVLGVLLMGYDDQYHPSKGAYFSWGSMNTVEKTVYGVFLFWNAINIVGILYLCYKLFIYISNNMNAGKLNKSRSANGDD